MSTPPSFEFCLEKASALMVKGGNHEEANAWSTLAIALRLAQQDIVEVVAMAAEDFVKRPEQEAHEHLCNMIAAWRGTHPLERYGQART